MFDKLERTQLTELHFKTDASAQLDAIIAIHSTALGPALGGCRCIEYKSKSDAIKDATRLARSMSYKAALARVPQGGGKAVIIKPPRLRNRSALYQAFGRFLNELEGRYITAVDSGTTLEDMDQVHNVSPYVAGCHDDGLDPSPMTALGVLAGIKASVKHRFDTESLQGLRVAIQGVGQVGYGLARLLQAEGAQLTISDIETEKVENHAGKLGAEFVSPEFIYNTPCDVFAPCGLGGILNDVTIPRLKCAIIAGAANNLLAEPRHGDDLHQVGILYAPDYVINAGGLIRVALGRGGASDEEINARTLRIKDTLLEIFALSATDDSPTNHVANRMAEQILNQAEKNSC